MVQRGRFGREREVWWRKGGLVEKERFGRKGGFVKKRRFGREREVC